MALITSKRKQGNISILASDLIGATEFRAENTLPAMDISSNQYNEGMSVYLQALGVSNIAEKYNEQLRQFELQLEEQEIASKVFLNVASESAANMQAEAQPGLGTGAAAVVAEGQQDALGVAHTNVEQQTLESYQTGVQEIAGQYQATLESVLGKYDATTGTFANLAEYDIKSNSATSALARVLALLINGSTNTSDDNEVLAVLKGAGYIDASALPGEFILNDTAKQQMNMLFGNINADKPVDALGGRTISNAIAEEMAKRDYLESHNGAGWAELSEDKRNAMISEAESWIINNIAGLKISAFNLYEKFDGGIKMLEYNAPKPETSIDGVDAYSGMPILTLDITYVSDCTVKEFEAMKQKLVNGEIADGAFITFQAGRMYDDDKYYYYENGALYKTSYNGSNPPPEINLNSANVYSFGDLLRTGKGGNDDEWINRVLKAARSGKIADGTYIDMNNSTGKERIYRYQDGVFYKVKGLIPEGSTFIHRDWFTASQYTIGGTDKQWLSPGNYKPANWLPGDLKPAGYFKDRRDIDW